MSLQAEEAVPGGSTADAVGVVERIGALYSHLTPTQRTIADFLLDHSDEASYLNSVQLSKRLNVGKPSVIRFAQRLGFPGFAGLRAALRDRTRQRLTMVDRLTHSRGRSESTESIISSVIESDILNLEQLRTEISTAVVDEVVDSLARARRLLVLGLRNSVSLAYFAWIALSQIRDRVELIRPGNEDWPEQVRGIGPEDVLLVFSFRRYTRRSLELVEQARNRGASIISVSDRRSSPLARGGEAVMVSPYSGPSFFGSLVAPMSVINIVIATMAFKYQASSRTSLEAVEEVLRSAAVLVDSGPRNRRL